MLDYGKILLDGGILSLAFTVIAAGGMMYDARLFLNKGDYPDDVLAAVPPKTKEEQRQALILGIPFFLLMVGFPVYSALSFINATGGAVTFWLLARHVFLVLMIMFFWDLVVLDWLIFCTITPSFVVIPGSEGIAGYKDYMFHLKGHTKGFFFYILPFTLVLTVVAWLIG